MKHLDVSEHAGRPDRPAVILVHGLGMDKHNWTAPDRARVLGGLFPLGIMLAGYPKPRTLWHDLTERGHTVVAWSQHRPVGPIEEAVGELHYILRRVRRSRSTGIILVGHSRGGMIARAALKELAGQNDAGDIRAYISISSPHHGSDMARWAVYLTPFAGLLEALIPGGDRKTLRESVKRSLGFLRSRGVRQLLPGSEFLASLGPLPEGIYKLSIGGTNPALITFRGISLPGSLARVLPGGVLPDEMKHGLGDGLVTNRSAVLEDADEHLAYPFNHMVLMVEPRVRRAIVERIEGLA